MSLQTYLISPYDHTAETQQFERIVALLDNHCHKNKENALLIGNYNIEGVEVDALLISRDGFLVMEFKNYGGHVIARENGSWTADGLIIKGGYGKKSPFEQIRLNRSRVARGLKNLLGVRANAVRAAIVFFRKCDIDDTQLSDTVKSWLTVCDDTQLPEVLTKEEKPILSDKQILSIPERLHIGEFASSQAVAPGIANKVYEQEASENLFEALETAVKQVPDYSKVYNIYNRIFQKTLEQKTRNTSFQLAGTFAKTDYLLKENQAPSSLVKSTNDMRVRLRKYHELSKDDLKSHYLIDLRGLCMIIAFLYKTSIPHSLTTLLPTEKPRSFSPTRLSECTRVIVEKWDDDFVYGQSEDSIDDEPLKICYSHGNKPYDYDWSYLRDLFYRGAQLNLVRAHEEDKIVYPELIIFEPDYLVNISNIAHCFTNYAESPIADLLQKIGKTEKTEAIVLGNFAGQLLDETISNMNGKKKYAQSITDFFQTNAISILSSNISEEFHANAQAQKKNIEKALLTVLPDEISKFDIGKGIVEPTFYSEMLGLLGRMDYLQLDFRVLMEQKSGKGDFPYDHFIYPRQKEEHYVQLLLYMSVIRYNYREAYDRNNHELHAYLLYSKYESSLKPLGFAPELFFRAIKVRNLIAWQELQYARPDGFRILDTLTPDAVNEKGSVNKLWTNYQSKQIADLLAPIRQANELEKAYYFRFLTFIAQEHMLSKLGNKSKENSGFASTWHNTLEEKLQSGNIYDKMTLLSPNSTSQKRVESVTLGFTETPDNDMSNFRVGDTVIIYPYDKSSTPDARRTIVYRGTINAIHTDNINLTLRSIQADGRAFLYWKDKSWAIEHDFIDSSFNCLYSGMHAFLSAPKERRDLLLLQREPETDDTVTLKGDYGSFNELALKVKRAKDLFLIIGPPGTGKTSFGMLNTVLEELKEPDSSVLLMSYTNRAVDEICSKLKEAAIDFIRVGNAASCSDEYKSFLIGKKVQSCKNITEVKTLIEETRVFVATTASMNSQIDLFETKQFSLAVVDEASQILEPYLIGLLSAHKGGIPAIKKVVLIGDHKQLPAVVQQAPQVSKVQDPRLREIQLTDCRLSLFERLLKRYEKSADVTYMLRRQGRMHQYIAHFPNHAFYNNQLIEVPLPHQQKDLATKGKGKDGITDLLLTRRIAFVASESPQDSLSPKVNTVEAEMIAATIKRVYEIERGQFDPLTTVGVIVPYRNQIATVRNNLSKLDMPQQDIDILREITIDTVERFQGSQRKYIIYGFTIQLYDQLDFLTNNVFEDSDGNIVDRKLNVAMTRAIEHLVMMGNPELLANNFTFFKLMEWVRSKHGYFQVKKDDYVAGRFHVPDFNAVELNPSKATSTFSMAFEKAFEELVTNPVKAASGDDWGTNILGHDMPTNLNAIGYGRVNCINRIRMFDGYDLTPEKQALLYCHYYMRQHYCSFRNILDTSKKWLESMADAYGGRLHVIDIGCGPATCGIAFCEEFLAEARQMAYTGIDISKSITQIGRQFINRMSNEKLQPQTYDSFGALQSGFWKSCSELPTLVVFSLSYFFSNTTAQYSEWLAQQIINVMQTHTLNKYVFIIQQSDSDIGLNAYKVFRHMLNPNVDVIRHESTAYSYMLDGEEHHQPFCYDILASKR